MSHMSESISDTEWVEETSSQASDRSGTNTSPEVVYEDNFVHQDCALCKDIRILLHKKRPIGDPRPDTDKIEGLERAAAFHTACEAIDTAEPAILCELCRHARLGHILRCMPKTWHKDYREISIWFPLGTWEKPLLREGCAFCRTITRSFSDEQMNTLRGCRLRFHISINLRILAPITHKIPYIATGNFNYFKTNLSSRISLQAWNFGFYEIERVPHGCDFTTPRISWQDFSRWIGLEGKAEAVELSTTDFPAGFCLIDVDRFCIRQGPPPAPYAALSYVWGTVEQELVLNVDNFRELQQQGRLGREDVPVLIKDAITACAKLGLSYLWVDRLCLVQDDEKVKAAQLGYMGKIYQNSLVTLVALEGEDVTQGLPGISVNRRQTTTTFVHLGLVAMALMEGGICKSISESTWMTRGWTYQEALLSQKLLVFSKDMLHLIYHDEIKTESAEPLYCYDFPEVFRRKDPYILDQLEGFNARQLTFQSDVLRAFTGVLSLFDSRHFYGVPSNDFDMVVLWRQLDWHSVPRPSDGDEVLPSQLVLELLFRRRHLCSTG